jgi:hypothetical protein
MTAIGFNEAIHFCIQENIELFDEPPEERCVVCITRSGENFSKMTDHDWEDFVTRKPPHVDQGEDWREHFLLKNFAGAAFRKPNNSRERELLARAEAIAREKSSLAKQKKSQKQGLWESGTSEVA